MNRFERRQLQKSNNNNLPTYLSGLMRVNNNTVQNTRTSNTIQNTRTSNTIQNTRTSNAVQNTRTNNNIRNVSTNSNNVGLVKKTDNLQNRERESRRNIIKQPMGKVMNGINDVDEDKTHIIGILQKHDQLLQKLLLRFNKFEETFNDRMKQFEMDMEYKINQKIRKMNEDNLVWRSTVDNKSTDNLEEKFESFKDHFQMQLNKLFMLNNQMDLEEQNNHLLKRSDSVSEDVENMKLQEENVDNEEEDVESVDDKEESVDDKEEDVDNEEEIAGEVVENMVDKVLNDASEKNEIKDEVNKEIKEKQNDDNERVELKIMEEN